MEPYFLWKGVDSRSMGLVVKEYPAAVKPADRTQEIVVPGRGGTLTIPEGDYVLDVAICTCVCAVLPAANMEALNTWLRGAGALVFGNEANRSYRARMDIQIDFERLPSVQLYREAPIPFACQPGKYLYPAASNITVTTKGTQITNPGTLPSQPQILVSGTGEVTLSVGVGFAAIIDGGARAWQLLIDGEMMDCFSADRSQLRNSWMTGKFPVIMPGANTVTWTGAISSVVITPNWRFL